MHSIYIICLTLCLISIFVEKNNIKKYKVLNVILFFLTIIVMVNADNVGDLSNYEVTYQETVQYGFRVYTDSGYAILMFIASKLGLSFFQFKCIGIILSMSIIYMTLIKRTNYLGFFIFFFSLHSLFLDAYQLRNFFAFSVVILALYYLLQEDSSLLVYILLIVIASTIHAMAIVYLLFVWIRLNSEVKKWTLRCLPFFFVVIFYLGINTNIISNVLLFFADFTSEGIADKIESYAVTKTRLGFLIPVLIYSCYLMFIKIINSKLIKDCTTVVRKRSIKKFIYSSKNVVNDNEHFLKLVEQINFIGVCYLPFNITSLTFYRLVRNICLFDLIYFAICFDIAKTKKDKLINFFGVLILILMWRYFDFNIYKGIEINEIYFYK